MSPLCQAPLTLEPGKFKKGRREGTPRTAKLLDYNSTQNAMLTEN